MQAGPYQWQIDNPASQTAWTAPWNIGVVEDAPEIEWTPQYEEILGDNLGDTVQDLLFRGGNAAISLVVQEFGMDAFLALNPYYNRTVIPTDLNKAIGDGGMASVGMLSQATEFSNAALVGSFRARATALHPDFSTMVPYQVYFNRITLAPNQPTTFRMGTRLKNVGARFLVFPHNAYDDPTAPVEDLTNPLVLFQTITSMP
jgi:hypothetical protein